MKYTSILSIPLLLAVSACSSMMGHHGKGMPRQAQPTTPTITVVKSASGIFVPILDQEPLVLTSDILTATRATDPATGKMGLAIVWTIDPNSGWEFEPEKGIVFETPPKVPPEISKQYGLGPYITFDDPANAIFGCRNAGSPTKYSCQLGAYTAAGKLNAEPGVGRQFKYTIHLRQAADQSRKISLDPKLFW